jgi:hypothetical protein
VTVIPVRPFLVSIASHEPSRREANQSSKSAIRLEAARLGKGGGRRSGDDQTVEAGGAPPIPVLKAAIVSALEEAGVEFIPAKNGKGVGVRLRADRGRTEGTAQKQ